MIYTLCWEEEEIKKDIKVNEEQRIQDTLVILYDGGILNKNPLTEGVSIYSMRRQKMIDVKLNYIQANIQNGDILYIR